MGTVTLADVTELETVTINELSEATSAADSDVAPMVISGVTKKIAKSNLLPSTFGDETNYSIFESDGRLHFHGTARPVIFDVMDSTRLAATHFNFLGITSLSASSPDGIFTEGLTVGASVNKRIEVYSLGLGLNLKGRLSNTYTRFNTTDIGSTTKIILSTTNASWVQASEWRLILEITEGTIVGIFTIIMPLFTLAEYSRLRLDITAEGAAYCIHPLTGGPVSVSGPNQATENLLSDAGSGSDVAISVSSTAGFYAGHYVFISDSSNSEWCRIKSLITDTSVTVDTLSNAYIVTDGAKLDIFDFIKAPLLKPLLRGMFSVYNMVAGENMGVRFQSGKPQSVDPDSDIHIILQYISDENNAGSADTKWRVEYQLKQLWTDIPESIQYGTIINCPLVQPPAEKKSAIAVLGIIPAETHVNKYMLTFKLIRLGRDPEDTFTGTIRIIGIILGMTHRQLGFESA